jgi:hypothetical protein
MPSDNRKGKEIKDITDRWMYTIVMDVRRGFGQTEQTRPKQSSIKKKKT